MKLYTEEQVVQTVSWLTTDDITREDIKLKLKGLIQINALTPIELPSDEEIEKNIEKLFYGEKKYYFKAGITWMKQHILNQNK